MPRAENRFIPLGTIWLLLICGGCAQIEFDATPEDGGPAMRVGNSQDVAFSSGPLGYRMRADEGHLILWIDNPTNEPVEFLGDKSAVVDPEGIAHVLRGETIAPRGSIKEIFPPVVEPPDAAPAAMGGVNNYDRPGFITVPNSEAIEKENDLNWQWDDTLEIRLNLFFQQSGHAFEQHFTVRRVRK
jgi:hypothetical protein